MVASQQASERQTGSQGEAQAAAAIAAALAGGTAAVGLAAVILGAMPLVGLGLFVRKNPEEAAGVAASVATIVLTKRRGGTSAGRMEDIYSAYYALAAARRLAAAGDREKALELEKRYYQMHLEAAKRRRAADRMTTGARSLYGYVLSWHHGHPKEPRPTHLAADGKNFDTRLGVPRSTGALPGELPNCTCYWGPPIPGAPQLH
ncbi:hypothetical protein [Rubrobacter calidifluminis]|uniref:hypothetical protein n=1 Tax=Rubrobacter calidifluminis TaxID=1392640 RepID=UPI00236147D6|nr:hypothetical protein [Rubrobacter calidifluminis]